MNSRNNVIHVVDDDASFRKSIYRLFSALDYRVVLHESRERALENISNVDRGCILLDLQMSGLNGSNYKSASKRWETLYPSFLSLAMAIFRPAYAQSRLARKIF